MGRKQEKYFFSVTDFGNIFSDLKSRLLITIGRNIEKTLDLIIDMYHKAADCMRFKESKNNKRMREPW